MIRLRAAIIAFAILVLGTPSVLARAASSTGYNGATAAAYADTYWSNYNPSWPSYANHGGDCTNFVSQALYAGGMQMRTSPTYSGNSAWYLVQNHKRWSYGLPWVNAQDDSIFLEQNLSQITTDSNATVLQDVVGAGPTTPISPQATQGDVVLYDWNNDGTFDHEAIITASDSPSTSTSLSWDLVDAHTTNRYHAFWTLAQYNASWATTRIVVLHISSGTV